MPQFSRQLGAQAGVQANPLGDASVVPTVSNADQMVATVARMPRGRIDKPFIVSAGSRKRLIGGGESVRKNALNAAYVSIFEGLTKGVAGVLLQRLVSVDEAKIGWAYATVNGTDIDFAVSDLSTAIVAEQSHLGSASVKSGGSDVTGHFIAIKHLECFTNGIMLEVHADELLDESDTAIANNTITLRILDDKGGRLFEFTGSLDEDAVDESGNSLFLESIIEAHTDLVDVAVVSGTSIPPTSDAYGYDASGQQKWVRSAILNTFEEVSGSFAGYTSDDYLYATDRLRDTEMDYGYLCSAGSASSLLLNNLAAVAHRRNVPFAFDLPGNLSADAALTLMKTLNMTSKDSNHLLFAYWAPLRSDCPAGINPPGVYSVAMRNLASACARNAVTNAYGLPAKNYPIAGVNYSLDRTNIKQLVTLRDDELSRLAKARINPVVFQTFAEGTKVVYRDSLTCSPANSLKKLIAVTEMSTTIDNLVVQFANSVIQKPMSVAIKETKSFMRDLFERAQKSGWIVPSDEPDMQGQAFVYSVQADPTSPADRLIYDFKLRYDGTTRQVITNQTVTK